MSAKNVVVVESPAKSKTIGGFLGSDFDIIATFGHIRDLPGSSLGVDVKKNFEPKYVIPAKARKTVFNLKNVLSRAQNIYLATDYDREGEAIAWHVVQACDLGNSKKIYRITFHEITKSALQNALKNPKDINQNLVDAQQARRILDRLVGYNLSPFLWKKVMKGLSAGRVQSVAVRLIVDRERQIEGFKPEEYWSGEGRFKVKNGDIDALLVQFSGKRVEKMDLKTSSQTESIKDKLEKDSFILDKIEETGEKKYPFPPYTTSTLQQDANKKLYFSSKQTMKLAQDLYEAGLITYMRTDSTSLASSAVSSARKQIVLQFGNQYLSQKPRSYPTKTKGAQEAHEAIRPTKPDLAVGQLGSKWSSNHNKLYQLIWSRFIACQMSEMELEKLSISVVGNSTDSIFLANGQKIKFDGFARAYPVKLTEKSLPQAVPKEKADLIKLSFEQHFTEPLPRFNEASLVKTLEKEGIGRPSTYAPTISTIIDRGYVRLENRVFFPQEIGFIVTDLLKKHFPEIVDLGFTSKMEDDLDDIASGKIKWFKPLQEFWGGFEKELAEKTKTVEKQDLSQPTGEKCPKCQKELVERLGRYGKFIACSGFPECDFTRQIVVDSGVKCPECAKGSLIERKTRKSRKTFWGCSRFPKCQYATWDDPSEKGKTSTNQFTNGHE